MIEPCRFQKTGCSVLTYPNGVRINENPTTTVVSSATAAKIRRPFQSTMASMCPSKKIASCSRVTLPA